MISYRQSDLLERFQRPLVDVIFYINFPFDNVNKKAKRDSSGRLYADLGVERHSHFEEVFTKVELAIGHRINDTIHAKEGEDFSHFGNRIKWEIVQALKKISAGPVKVELVNGNGKCEFEIKFKVRI